MSESIAVLADRLSEVLAAETTLLESLDLAEAGALLDRKREALAALQSALEAGGIEASGEVRTSFDRLRALTEANRAALERGLAAQQRLIQAIADAVPQAQAGGAPVYQQDGRQLPPRPPQAYALLCRA
jgi:hypothetical protein